MRTLEELTAELTEAIKNTEEYRAYCDLRDKVRQMPELERAINEFRHRTMEMNRQYSGEELYDRLDETLAESEKFRSDPLVDEYLKYELAVCRMLQNVYAQISEAIDLDL